MQPKFEFEVIQLRTGTDDAFVEGRNCGALIRVGDVFTWICSRVPKGNGRDFIAGEIALEGSVQITVLSIEAYHHQLDELSSGMTARMKVVGAGIEKLKEGKVLTGNPQT